MKLSEATELLLMDAAARRLSPMTIRFYRQRCQSVIKVIGDSRAEHITANDVRSALASTTAASARLNFAFLRRLFRFLHDEEVTSRNPLERVTAPKTLQKVIYPLTIEEIRRCYKYARVNRGFFGLRNSVIFATLLGTGMRRQELCSLREKDVRISERLLLVHGKGGTQRLLPIPSSLKQLLARYRFARNETRVASRQCDRFFRDRGGGPLTPANVTRVLERLGKVAGVHLHPHRLRHTFATAYMSNDGADVLSLQSICGWSTIAMATRYTKPSLDKLKRSMESFSPANQLSGFQPRDL